MRDARADSQDKQKKQADAKGRICIESFEVGDQVLLTAKNQPTNVVSAVFKTKLLPRFIGPFAVVTKKNLAYTLNLPRKLRTPPVFYVGLLKSYQDLSQVDREALALRMMALPQAAASRSGGQAASPCVSDSSQTLTDGLAPRQTYAGSYPSLPKTVHLVNRIRVGCSQHTDSHRRCLTSKGTSSSMWISYFYNIVVMANTII